MAELRRTEIVQCQPRHFVGGIDPPASLRYNSGHIDPCVSLERE
jgi:hypothetical protein